MFSKNSRETRVGITVMILVALAAVICAIVLIINNALVEAAEPEPVKPLPYYDCSLCEHDESTYEEPTIKEGRYYLDADTNQCFFELKNGYINLVGTNEQIQELTKKTADMPYPLTVDGIKSSWAEGPRKYYIVTMHPYGDRVVLGWIDSNGNGVKFDEEGRIVGIAGIGFNNETGTISGYAGGIFTLIE